MMISFATINDLLKLDQLAYDVITHMKESNIPQWEYSYPRFKDFSNDVLNNALIVYKEHNKIIGCMAFLKENDPPYKTINSWLKEHSVVIHRVLVKPNSAQKGIAKQMLDFVINDSINKGYESIKIDTHLDNYKMRNFLMKNGFVEGDYIESIDRIAYELVLEENNE